MYASRQLCLNCFASSGNVSSGKSTFINNLLPSNLLPTKHLHSTGKMCRIRKGRPNERKIRILTIDERVIGEYNNLDMLAELADVTRKFIFYFIKYEKSGIQSRLLYTFLSLPIMGRYMYFNVAPSAMAD